MSVYDFWPPRRSVEVFWREWGLGFMLAWYADTRWLSIQIGPVAITFKFRDYYGGV